MVRAGRRPIACAAGLILLAAGGCASWPSTWSERPCCVDTKPTVRRQPIAWHLLDVTLIEPVEQLADVGRWGRRLTGVPVRSLNLGDAQAASAIGETAFFTDRPIATLSDEAVRWGPTNSHDAPRPPYTITALKTEGKTPGMFVTDRAGRRYLFKFDPVGAPELLSGAEVVTSKLLYALGYHVPSYEAVWTTLEELQLGPEVSAGDGHTARHGLERMLAQHVRDGRLRVSASRFLEGDILGPARFERFRDCTEVRALKLAYAWVNDTDAKDHNTLLVWDGARTRGYLIDFGTSLGADAGLAGPKAPCAGTTYEVDPGVWVRRLVTLGWYRPGCGANGPVVSPSIGRFAPALNPSHWKPYVPNLAFQQMNEDDARWMARRLAQLTRRQLEAAVAAGQYARSEDVAYLVEALDRRRGAIVERYLKGDEGL